MNKILKILVFIVLFAVLLSTNNYIMAADLDNIIKGGDDFINQGNTDEVINKGNVEITAKSIYNIVLTIGIIVAVVMAIVLGIQYITASVEGQAKIKEKILPFIIGCAIMFGAFAIWKILVDVLQGINW